jgi:hypothetical protein
MQKLLFFLLALFPLQLLAQAEEAPDTVKVGVYVVSVNDIDFRQKEYTIRFWLWLKYRNPEFDFARNLEVPNSKTMETSDGIVDTIDGEVYVLTKVKCVMKETWVVQNYPFDKQFLEVFIENSQYDTRSLVFVADTAGEFFDPALTVSGWDIAGLKVHTGIRKYETAFGDATLDKPHAEYASFSIQIGIERNAWGLFFKIFLGMYVSFLITFISFFIHGDKMDSRFGLCVGALFAAVGNKYIIDSILPESSAFTLVDALHAYTFVSIFITIWCSVHTLNLAKQGDFTRASVFDARAARILLTSYLLLNIASIVGALLL